MGRKRAIGCVLVPVILLGVIFLIPSSHYYYLVPYQDPLDPMKQSGYLRTIETHLCSYRVDHGTWPSGVPHLTTPIDYFRLDAGLDSVPWRLVVNESEDTWLILMAGPDQRIDTEITSATTQADVIRYDPTNGARSGGDLVRSSEEMVINRSLFPDLQYPKR